MTTAYDQLADLATSAQEAGEVVRRVAVEAVRSGALSEVKAAEAAGVSRPTLRKWLGK